MDYNLDRFVDAQNECYEQVIKELTNGRKKTHWMWYIFPQIDGLGFSEISRFYSIKSIDETNAYYNHELLGSRLKECIRIINGLDIENPEFIFGYIDSLKLKSSLTLFYEIIKDQIFMDCLNKFYNGEFDKLTLNKIKELR